VAVWAEDHRYCQLLHHANAEVAMTSSSEDKGNAEESAERAGQAIEHAAEAEERAREAEQHAREAEQRAREAEEQAREAERHAREAEEHVWEAEEVGGDDTSDSDADYAAPSVDSYGGEEPPDGGPE
jgi:hypothetical protein